MATQKLKYNAPLKNLDSLTPMTPSRMSLTLSKKNSTSTALNHLNQIGSLSSLMLTGLKLKNPETKALHQISLFIALGIDLTGTKHILGFWYLKGKESKAFWLEILQDLINRRLKRPLLFVTDDFPGLTEVIKKLFPYAKHQLCLIHLQRNFKSKLNKRFYSQAKAMFLKLKTAIDKQEGESIFDKLCEIAKEKNEDWGKQLFKKRDNYLAFLEYPQEVRKHIYSTNAVESINSGLEGMVTELGGYFPSQRSLEVNVFIQISNLQDRWWRKPMPTVRAVSYELQQIFTLTYKMEAVL